MKKLIAVILAVTLLAMGGGVALANDVHSTDLIADGGSAATAIDIGDVSVWGDCTNLYVKYVVTEPNWVITHVHFHVDDDADDIPQNRKGNPKIGHFEYSVAFSPGVTEYTSDPISTPSPDDVYIAAQAEVYYNESVVYGIESATNEIHAINPISGDSTYVADIPLALGQPNAAAAFNSVSNRLYYQEYSTQKLYFYDVVADTHFLAGTLTASTQGASFYGENYYYIAEITDDLYVVAFDGAGAIVSDTKLADISSNARTFDFGDIAVASDGTIYGAAWDWTAFVDVFFEVSTGGASYTEIATGTLTDWPPQLAFGSDGTLYANGQGVDKFYVVDKATGDMTEISTISQYADLASGSAPTRFETAWGDGTEFTRGRSWAMYLTYDVCPDP